MISDTAATTGADTRAGSVDATRKRRRNDPAGTRANILEVARDEFVERGFSGARVDAIAAKTETSKRMLYYYFGGKEGLYREVLRASYEEIRDAEQGLDFGDLPPDEALCRLVRLTVEHHVANPQYVRLVMIENIHHGRFMKQLDEIESLNAAAIDVLAKIYHDGCARGVFRPGLQPIDLHWLISALAFFSVSNRATFGLLFKEHMHDPKAATADRLAEDVVLRFVAKPGALAAEARREKAT